MVLPLTKSPAPGNNAERRAFLLKSGATLPQSKRRCLME